MLVVAMARHGPVVMTPVVVPGLLPLTVVVVAQFASLVLTLFVDRVLGNLTEISFPAGAISGARKDP